MGSASRVNWQLYLTLTWLLSHVCCPEVLADNQSTRPGGKLQLGSDQNVSYTRNHTTRDLQVAVALQLAAWRETSRFAELAGSPSMCRTCYCSTTSSCTDAFSCGCINASSALHAQIQQLVQWMYYPTWTCSLQHWSLCLVPPHQTGSAQSSARGACCDLLPSASCLPCNSSVLTSSLNT